MDRGGRNGTLVYEDLGDSGGIVHDTRFNRVASSIELDPVIGAIFVHCDQVRRRLDIASFVRVRFGESAPGDDEVSRILCRMQDLLILVSEADRYFNVAMMDSSFVPWLLEIEG